MKGRIYTAQKCFYCQGPLKYVEGRGYLACQNHPALKWHGACIVRFGREHTKRFQSVIEAERHLTYLRVQTDQGKFDQREWAKEQPLSFLALRLKFIDYKKTLDITEKQVKDIERVLKRAGKGWDHQQIKDITEEEIEDFFLANQHKAKKTLANWRTALHDFWTWVVRRERRKSGLPMPEFPVISFKMKLKTTVSIPVQQQIIDEVKRISWDINPRVWLAVWLLSLYPRIRPGEMIAVKEGHINLTENYILFPQPKEREPKYIHLLPEAAAQIRAIRDMHPAMPGMYFFRHIKRRNGLKVGTRFGPKYLNTWWKKACANLGVEGVTIYPGTKHSTVTALGKVMSPEQIQHNVTGHVSDAFKRYFLPEHQETISATMQVAELQERSRSSKGEIIQIKREG